MAARLCAQRAGLKVDPQKIYLIESRLAPVARREGFASVDELLGAVRDRDEERLIRAVVEAMVIPQTWFFHDAPTLRGIRERLLPELAARRGGQPIRIWNPACGSGQDIYSLAMMLVDGPDLGAPVELFASGFSERLLEKAQRGVYSQFEVQRGLPARMLVRHFERRDDAFVLSSEIRRMVRWRRVGLTQDLSGLGRFDVILCRGVLGALVEDVQDQVLRSLTSALRPDRFLVLGAGEPGGEGLRPAPGVAGAFALQGPVQAAA